jgi:hypothetical protein
MILKLLVYSLVYTHLVYGLNVDILFGHCYGNYKIKPCYDSVEQ